MDFWENDELYAPKRLAVEEEALLEALSRNDEMGAAEILKELRGPVSERGTPFCLRGGLNCTPELFRQVLEHCAPGEYSESYTIGMGDGFVQGRGSMLLLAAVLDRPRHARLLLEHGYDCNSAGVGFDWNLQRMRTAYQDTVPTYAQYCGACGNRLELRDWAERCTWSVSCATPLAAALLFGSLQTGEVLLNCSGVWKKESSAVCRAAVMVLEGVGCSLMSEDRQAARMELLRQIFCPEWECLPDRDVFLRTHDLQPVCCVDFCSVRTLRCQLESGLCGEKDTQWMLELQSGDHEPEEPFFDSARSGKLLLLKRYFPVLCHQSWAAGVFLREVLLRCRYGRPCRTLLRAWKQLCGRERDLTWGGQRLWQLDHKVLRRFLQEAGEGGTLVLDGDAVPPGYAPACLAELLDRVRFRQRGGAGISGLLQVLMETGDLRLLRRAAMRGVLAGEDPAALMPSLFLCLQAGPESAPRAAPGHGKPQRFLLLLRDFPESDAGQPGGQVQTGGTALLQNTQMGGTGKITDGAGVQQQTCSLLLPEQNGCQQRRHRNAVLQEVPLHEKPRGISTPRLIRVQATLQQQPHLFCPP